MPKFKDAEGKEWDLRITAGHLRPLREDFGIDLRKALDPEDNSLAVTLGDPEKFGQVLWVLLEPQAEKAGIKPEEFAYRFDGEAIERAGTALWGAIVGFFRPGTQDEAGAAFRRGLDRLTAKTRAAWEAVTDDALDRALASPTSKTGATNSAGVPASTPPEKLSAS